MEKINIDNDWKKRVRKAIWQMFLETLSQPPEGATEDDVLHVRVTINDNGNVRRVDFACAREITTR